MSIVERFKRETKCKRFTLYFSMLENGYCYLREYKKSSGTSVKTRISKKKFNNNKQTI